MAYYLDRAEEALERALELHAEADRLPNPGSFRRGIMGCFVNSDGETDLQKQERIDEQRIALRDQAAEYVREVAEYADRLMDELEARGMDRKRLRSRFLRLIDNNPRGALRILAEAVELVEAAERAAPENEPLRSGIIDSVRETANNYGLESDTAIWDDNRRKW